MKKHKVLLITRECLRADSNEGNVLLQLFKKQDMVLANIYCKPGLPDSTVCSSYFQLTDGMALRNVLKRQPMGNIVQPETEQTKPFGETENKPFYDFFRRHNFEMFYFMRELLWQMANFKSDALTRFVQDFAPDVIFAPLCYSRYVLAVQRYVIKLANVPAVTYIYDDLYSLRQWRFSPIYWFNRFALRAAIRKMLPFYQYAYTMTDQQAQEYKHLFALPIRVLRKGASIPLAMPQQLAHKGVRLLYAGGIYFGRDKTLAAISDAVRAMRKEGLDVRMDIYTSSPLSKKARAKLNDGEGCCLHAVVPFDTLCQQYRESDIALHVESFQKKNALLTRLSFSTKIVDCLASGCAVLAICPPVNAGFQYLKVEDAAVCVSHPEHIEKEVRQLVCDATLRKTYAKKAFDCLARNHSAEQIRHRLQQDLITLRRE